MLAIVAALVRAAPEPCKSGCLCDTGAAKTVPDIWPNASGVLCNPQAKTCEVCGDCNQLYPKCPCCNPIFGEAASCLNCRLDHPKVCGNPVVSYSCDQAQQQCAAQSSGGEYLTKAACETACVDQQLYICQDIGKGDQCYETPKGTPGSANKTACKANCGSPTPAPPTPVPPGAKFTWGAEGLDCSGSGTVCHNKSGSIDLTPDGNPVLVSTCENNWCGSGCTYKTYCTLTKENTLVSSTFCTGYCDETCRPRTDDCVGPAVTKGCSTDPDGTDQYCCWPGSSPGPNEGRGRSGVRLIRNFPTDGTK
jgi:hypothetical protein